MLGSLMTHNKVIGLLSRCKLYNNNVRIQFTASHAQVAWRVVLFFLHPCNLLLKQSNFVTT